MKGNSPCLIGLMAGHKLGLDPCLLIINVDQRKRSIPLGCHNLASHIHTADQRRSTKIRSDQRMSYRDPEAWEEFQSTARTRFERSSFSVPSSVRKISVSLLNARGCLVPGRSSSLKMATDPFACAVINSLPLLETVFSISRRSKKKNEGGRQEAHHRESRVPETSERDWMGLRDREEDGSRRGTKKSPIHPNLLRVSGSSSYDPHTNTFPSSPSPSTSAFTKRSPCSGHVSTVSGVRGVSNRLAIRFLVLFFCFDLISCSDLLM